MDWRLVLLIAITISVTALIVWGLSWIDKNKEKYPALYKRRMLIRSLICLVLNSGDIR